MDLIEEYFYSSGIDLEIINAWKEIGVYTYTWCFQDVEELNLVKKLIGDLSYLEDEQREIQIIADWRGDNDYIAEVTWTQTGWERIITIVDDEVWVDENFRIRGVWESNSM